MLFSMHSEWNHSEVASPSLLPSKVYISIWRPWTSFSALVESVFDCTNGTMIHQCEQTWLYFLTEEVWKMVATAVDSVIHRYCQDFMILSHYHLQMVPSPWGNANIQGRRNVMSGKVRIPDTSAPFQDRSSSRTKTESQDVPGPRVCPTGKKRGRVRKLGQHCVGWFRPGMLHHPRWAEASP